MPHATLNPPTSTPLLREWAKVKLTCDFWRDALLSALGVSISFYTHIGIDTLLVRIQFTLPRVMLYWVVCECLEVMVHITNVVECFH